MCDSMTLKVALLSVGMGILGMLLAVGALHLYQDHLYLHGLINLVQTQSQKASAPSSLEKHQ